MIQKFNNYAIKLPKGVKLYHAMETPEATVDAVKMYMSSFDDNDIEIYKSAERNRGLYRNEDGEIVTVNERGKINETEKSNIIKDDTFNMDTSMWGHSFGRKGTKQSAIRNTQFDLLKANVDKPVKAVVCRHEVNYKGVYVDIPQYGISNMKLISPMYDYREDMLEKFYPIGKELYVIVHDSKQTGVFITDNDFIPDIFTSLATGVEVTFRVIRKERVGWLCEAEYDGVVCRAYVPNSLQDLKVGDEFKSPLNYNRNFITPSFNNGVWMDYKDIVSKSPNRTVEVFETARGGFKCFDVIPYNGTDGYVKFYVPNFAIENKDRENIVVGSKLNVTITDVNVEKCNVRFVRKDA